MNEWINKLLEIHRESMIYVFLKEYNILGEFSISFPILAQASKLKIKYKSITSNFQIQRKHSNQNFVIFMFTIP